MFSFESFIYLKGFGVFYSQQPLLVKSLRVHGVAG